MKKYIIILAIAFFAIVSVTNAQEYTFSHDLSVGVSGADVSALQSWLITNGYDIPAISSGVASRGYFGAQTRVALIKYQNFVGLPAFGFFGPLTRGKINVRKIIDIRAPVINGIDAPTTLNVNQMGTWTVRASDPQNGVLSYSVDWGDTAIYASVVCPAGFACLPDAASTIRVQQGSTFTHSYSNAGIYTVRFSVKNSSGLTAESSATVRVGPGSGASPLTIISPNSGENWKRGTTQTISWTSPAYFRATYADITLVPYYAPCTGQICPMGSQSSMMYPYHAPYSIVTNININQNSFAWSVGSVRADVQTQVYPPITPTAPDGQYTIQICETGTSNCDSSDRPFTIFTTYSPGVLSPNGGEAWQSNSTQTIRWDTTGMDLNTKLDLYLDQTNVVINCITVPCPMTAVRAAYTLDRNIPISTIYNWIVATDINNVIVPTGNYTVRVCLAGTTNCDSSDKYFSIFSQYTL